jgi:hypothetical protein
MYGFCTAMAWRGCRPRSASRARQNDTFSPVCVACGSMRMRSRGTPRATATSAKISASGRVQISLVSEPRLPEKTTSGAQPSRNTSAARSATRVSWLPRTNMASALARVWPRWW